MKNKKRKLVILSGAGISAESGIQTFRDSDGLWENFKVEDVATIDGWRKDRELVLDFYNQRRKQLHIVAPNETHKILVELEKDFDVQIITQNVDNLHEAAGSTKVLHLHGELFKVRSTRNSTLFDNDIIEWFGDLNIGDIGADGFQLRPHIVWFGEQVPMLEKAENLIAEADYVAIIGTSMQVYPAANLIYHAKSGIPIYYIDPNPVVIENIKNVSTIKKNATEGVAEFKEKIRYKNFRTNILKKWQ